MKLERAKYDSGELLEFYEHALCGLGALCERTWHDRLHVVAEGRSARLWNADGALHEVELQFAPANATMARDAAREVFPGCPLTFQLGEALRSSPLPLERFVLPEAATSSAWEAVVAEKLWRAQFPDTTRWQLAAPFKPGFHFSLLALTRCEIQAIDQRWSLHRLAFSLPDGQEDDDLAREIGFHHAGAEPISIPWPSPNPARWTALLQQALELEISAELAEVRARQENSIRRELARIDSYFENYERELAARFARVANEKSKIKMADRRAAARAEHHRRRADQLARHEIRVQPHVDGLLLIAEKAWRASVRVERSHRDQTVEALLVPRSRRWVISAG
ncbi:MAG: hypothetical protein ACREFR_02500 [Limisphaerales bacterium]